MFILCAARQSLPGLANPADTKQPRNIRLATRKKASILDAVLRRLGLLFAALALFSIAGGHWAVLQTVAWAGMLRDYTLKTGSVAAAVEQTFDGQHPCELCLQIAAAKQQEAKARSDEQKPSSEQQTAKAEKNDKALPLEQDCLLAQASATCLRWEARDDLGAPSRTERPPTPPPRSKATAA